MININNLKKIKSNFPVMIGKNFINSKDCKIIINEIENAKVFDDIIQGGRSRINKGSKNFKKYLSKSKISNKLYRQFNNKEFYEKVETKFKKAFKDYNWSNTNLPHTFLPNKYTNKRLMDSNELKRMLGVNYKDPKVNLDIDFSVSRAGYKLRPHRDDITRVYNFLIYLNDIPKKNGGSLTIFREKSSNKIKKIFRRFPKKRELIIMKEFIPTKGSIIFFQSTPNSYHGVKSFKATNGLKRFFIYGSYALSKPVVWKYKNFSYFPCIKKTSKKLLTSSHNSDYLLKNDL
jgi:Rps23 Pro-64 3,4-dihydroxylase Tpa1-like proline 4-hydroxylase